MTFAFGSGLDLVAFSKNWGKFLVWGIILLILGLLAIGFATFTTLLSVIALGFFFFASGIVLIIDTLTFRQRKRKGFVIHLIMGVLYLLLGVVLIGNPIWASVSLTLFLGVFYLVLGLFRIFYSSYVQLPKWGWVLFNGVISLLLGLLILYHWPESSLFIIGLFVGIDLLFAGWAYIMAALAGKALVSR